MNITGAYNEQNVTLVHDQASAKRMRLADSDYQVYSTFWGVQQYFAKKNHAFENWTQFNLDTQGLLTAFESQPTTKASMNSDFFTPKYLTSPSLFQLELNDPKIRSSVLVQLLIVLARGKHSEEPSIDLKDLELLQTRATALLKDMNAADVAQACIERDVHWLDWKVQDRCLAFEKEPEKLGPVEPDFKDKPKKKLPVFEIASWKESLKVANPIAPSLETHINPMVEALDPENGIEEEYHPKKNLQYCWSGLRLFCRQHLDKVGPKGDYLKVVKEHTGYVEPVEELQEEVQKVQEEEDVKEVESKAEEGRESKGEGLEVEEGGMEQVKEEDGATHEELK